MPQKLKTLKELFSNDPEMLRVLEAREQTAILRELADKKVSLDGIEQIKGDKGDRGDTPEKGVDYFTPEEVGDFLEKTTPKKGIHYFDGKDGEDGRDGKDGLSIRGENGKDGIDGEDGTSVTEEDIKPILEEMIAELELGISEKEAEKLVKKHSKNVSDNFSSRLQNLRDYVERNYGGHGGSGGGVTPQAYDLSPYLNGVSSSFTIPANTAIIQITSSSAPFVFRPTVDYTGSGTTTLTFDAGIDPASMLASGQSIIILYY